MNRCRVLRVPRNGGAGGWKAGLAAAMLLITGGVSAMGTTTDTRIALSAQGPEGTGYSIECAVMEDGELHQMEFEGEVPLTIEFKGDSVDCRVVQTHGNGVLEIMLKKNGNVTRSRSQGPNSTMNIRIR